MSKFFTPWMIRSATVEDAPSIFNLIQQSFEPHYLPYMLYQVPESANYLQELIKVGFERSRHTLWCATLGNEVVGFYVAVLRGAEFFLNHIAVAPHIQGTGLGQRLLDHFEAIGRDLRCKAFALDVFESNQRACNWYLNREYQLQSRTWLMQIAITRWEGKSSCTFKCDEAAFKRALEEETSRGFSKIDYSCESGTLTVGLIAKRMCKLLDYSQLDLVEAIAGVCEIFREQRRELVISSPKNPPDNWPIISAEKAWRLFKYSESSP